MARRRRDMLAAPRVLTESEAFIEWRGLRAFLFASEPGSSTEAFSARLRALAPSALLLRVGPVRALEAMWALIGEFGLTEAAERHLVASRSNQHFIQRSTQHEGGRDG